MNALIDTEKMKNLSGSSLTILIIFLSGFSVQG